MDKQIINKNIISIIIPIYNAALTINDLFESLEKQYNKDLIREIIIIDSKSTDQSINIINEWKIKSSFSIQVVRLHFFTHVSGKYNEGIKRCQSPYFIIMHQDSLIIDKDAFKKALKPVFKSKVVASYPLVVWSRKIWENYSFWRKYMLPVGHLMPVCAGKFDCFNKKLFLREIGYWNEKIDASEDMNLIFKVKKKRLKLILSNVKIIHNHANDSNFTLWQSLKVLFRVNEIQGYFFRQYGIISIQHFAITFFRPILILGLLIPYIRYIFICLIIIYCFSYSGSMYFARKKDIRLLLIPLVNFIVLFASSYYSLKGIIVNDVFHEKT